MEIATRVCTMWILVEQRPPEAGLDVHGVEIQIDPDKLEPF